ncbi:MAG: hypothetical protein RIC89_19160, partial [Pseudomonadales bacterium]
QGLNPPDVVLQATKRYFEDEDLLQQWLADRCTPSGYEPTARLYEDWAKYAAEGGEDAGSKKAFSAKLTSLGFHAGNSSAKGGRHFAGISLRVPG